MSIQSYYNFRGEIGIYIFENRNIMKTSGSLAIKKKYEMKTEHIFSNQTKPNFSTLFVIVQG